MRLLLDTHAFLWFINDSAELSYEARAAIEDGENELFLSYASLWEMAIKISLGKLSMPEPFDHFINEQVQLNQISLLSFTIPQIAPIATLPFHHRDPFDRMLVAQALSENLPVLSRDAAFDAYSVQRIW